MTRLAPRPALLAAAGARARGPGATCLRWRPGARRIAQLCSRPATVALVNQELVRRPPRLLLAILAAGASLCTQRRVDGGAM